MKKILFTFFIILSFNSFSFGQCISGDGKPVDEIVAESIKSAIEICKDLVEIACEPVDPVAWIELSVDLGEAAVDAIETAFKNNALGNPMHVYVKQDLAKVKGGYLWQPKYKDGSYGEDVLTIKATPKAGSSSRITLSEADKLNWWKGLVKFDKNDTNTWSEIVCNYNDTRKVSNSFAFADAKNNYIVLSKAKAWGVHTNMYHIVNFEELDQNYDWTFIWLEDGYSGKYKGSTN